MEQANAAVEIDDDHDGMAAIVRPRKRCYTGRNLVLLEQFEWCITSAPRNGFGSCEIRPQEHRATIDRVAQREQIIEQTLSLIKAVSEAE